MEFEPKEEKKIMNEQGMQDSFYNQPEPLLSQIQPQSPLVYDLRTILICLYFLSRSKPSMKIRYIAQLF